MELDEALFSIFTYTILNKRVFNKYRNVAGTDAGPRLRLKNVWHTSQNNIENTSSP